MRRLLYLSAVILLASCTGKNNSGPENGKIMYTRAMENFKMNRVRSAIDDFEKLETSYDFAKYHEAMVMIAYAHYTVGDYSESLLKIDSIKKLNMDMQNLQYVYYLEILDKYNMATKSGRDLTMLKELFSDANSMLTAFPGSIYESDVIEKRKVALDYIVRSELDIAKFYIENNNLIGALNHLREIIDGYPENIHSPEASYLMYKLYSHIGYIEGRDLYRALLHERYRNSRWFRKISG